MAVRASSPARWDERISRASRLADRHPAAAEILTFYATLAGYQRSLAARWKSGAAASLADLVDPVLDAVPDFLAWLGADAPPRLTAAVGEMRRLDGSVWRVVLEDYLARRGEATPAENAPRVFVVEALVQPLAEELAGQWQSAADRPTPPPGASRCPFCDDLPSAGVLREEGEGAKRSLVCGRCLTEWSYYRLVCPACDERRFDALPVFTSHEIPGARVEACDTCRRYLKTIDLTRDGHAVPYVDDLATVALDLWAREQGYARLRPNLLTT